MLLPEQLARYNLAYIAEVYAPDLSNGLEESKLKISKANKGKRLGCAPWNKGKKLHYIPGKREHSEQTLQKMSEAAKRRWSSMYNNNI